ncbi:MAG: alpha/beta fold hydrolase, partial [Bacteroidales bacterium]|nr:alpha/beta fold hydrolase [Bacteroidales bacterium]
INPKSGQPFYFDFPKTTVRDLVRANILIRKHLGIESIDLMIGPSLGGFQTLEWVIMEPEVVKNAIFLATATRAMPYLVAFNESQRMALEADPTFREAKSLKGGAAGLSCARSIALISYRNYDCYNLRQQETDEDVMFSNRACTYQQHQGYKLINRFDAYSYWYLSYCFDSQNIGRGRGGVANALKRIKAHCMVISIDTDILFPPKQAKETARLLKHASYHELTSIYGHDGFLIEGEQLTEILSSKLNTL